MSVSEIARQIAALSTPEKESLLQQLSSEGGFPANSPKALPTPAIVKAPDVCGGSARIIRTRIPVWTLQNMRQLGATEADILRNYLMLRAIDLVQAWQYADDHREEIEQEILENEEE